MSRLQALLSRSAQSLQLLVDTIADARDDSGTDAGHLLVVGLLPSTHRVEWLGLVLLSLLVIFVQT